MKILLIEDDAMLSAGLHKALTQEGFGVKSTLSGRDGIQQLRDFEPDIIILDLGLPDLDGMSVLSAVRQVNGAIPVLILTARESVSDKVLALDNGADDYLAKPFDMSELLARMRVLARRLGAYLNRELRIDGVCLDLAAHRLTIDGASVEVTRREFMVLQALMENAGRIQTKEMIEGKLYGWGEAINSNTIEVHISNLRKKLPGSFIKTIRGVGYTIETQALTDG